MNITKLLLARWRNNWQDRKLSKRIERIALEFLLAGLITLFMIAIVGAVMVNYYGFSIGPIGFIFIIYLLLLGIYTNKLFSQERIDYILAQIKTDLANYEAQSAAGCMGEIKQLLQEIELRMRSL